MRKIRPLPRGVAVVGAGMSNSVHSLTRTAEIYS